VNLPVVLFADILGGGGWLLFVFSFVEKGMLLWGIILELKFEMCSYAPSYSLSTFKECVLCWVYNPRSTEAEAGGSQVQDQPGLHNETLSQNNKTNR
jgi:hypothetical protein